MSELPERYKNTAILDFNVDGNILDRIQCEQSRLEAI